MIDLTILVVIGIISAAQTGGTIETEQAMQKNCISVLHILMQNCGTRQVGWFSKRTLTHRICRNHKKEAEQEIISTWEEQTKITTDQTEKIWSSQPS